MSPSPPGAGPVSPPGQAGGPPPWLGLVLVALGAAAGLVSQFSLDPWASVSQLGDWVQHGLIFWGGIGVGTGVAVLWRQGRGPRS